MARILVADDEPAVRAVVVRALEARGHEVTAVADGLSACEQLAAQHYDLLVTDVVMPGMDGIELALEAARRWPALKVLIMTGYADAEQRAVVEAGSVSAVMTKPFTLKDFCDTAQGMLAS